MNDAMKSAKEACDKAYAEYNKANLNLCNALTIEEKESAKQDFLAALRKFNEAHQYYAKLQLDALNNS